MKVRRFPLKPVLVITFLALTVSVDVALSQGGKLTVHFLDVGQADSILIQAPGGQAILIDGGNNDHGQPIANYNYLKQHGVTRPAALVATHPHEDHFGGLDTVLNAFSA